MVNRCVKCAVVLALCLALGIPVGCNIQPLVIPPDEVETEQSASEDDIAGEAGLPSGGRQAEYEQTYSDATYILHVAYEDFTLKNMMEFLDSLESEGWYLSENSAYCGSRSVKMQYGMDTQYLSLNYQYDLSASEWPVSVLTPYLAYAIPPFPYGQYDGFEEKEFSNGNAVQLIFRDVSRNEIEAYLALLESKADQVVSAKQFYIGRAFVNCDYFLKTARISIGLNRDFCFVPLPPWPDVPEFLQRILPAVSAVITITQEEDGVSAVAKNVSLSDLHHFFASALQYGWVLASNDDKDSFGLAYPEYSLELITQSYRSDTEIWTLNIYGDLQEDPG